MVLDLCCGGWLELYGMKVGFLKKPMFTLVGVLWIVMSR